MSKRVAPYVTDINERSQPTKRFQGTEIPKTVNEEAKDEPGSLRNFVENQKMIQVLHKLGIKCLFPIQYKTYKAIYKGDDIKAKDKTGSGKTLAFSLPIIQRLRKKGKLSKQGHPKFLVVLPTRELVIQVASFISSLQISQNEFNVVGIYGGSEFKAQAENIRRGCDIAVATPGRLLDFLNKKVISFQSLEVSCLDEADEMLKKGFQQDIENIFEFVEKDAPAKTQNLLFSATLPSWVNQISEKYQSKDCILVDLIQSNQISTPKTIRHLSVNVKGMQEMPSTISEIILHFTSQKGRVIVFCQTKRQVNQLSQSLKKFGSCSLHGDIPQKDRELIYHKFKTGAIKCIVATNVAARGLDFPEVELVVQAGPPKELESYIHRSGRTGRAGKKGVCVTVVRDKELYKLKNVEKMANIMIEDIRRENLSKEGRGQDTKPDRMEKWGRDKRKRFD